jgi:hypothetical protein
MLESHPYGDILHQEAVRAFGERRYERLKDMDTRGVGRLYRLSAPRGGLDTVCFYLSERRQANLHAAGRVLSERGIETGIYEPRKPKETGAAGDRST